MNKFSFVKNRFVFFGIAAVMVIAAIVSFFTIGFNWDIEFIGGTEISYDLGKTVEKDDEAKIESIVKDIIGADMYSSLRVVGDNKETVIIRTKLVDEQEADTAVDETVENVKTETTVDETVVDETVVDETAEEVVADETAVDETAETETVEETAEEAEAETGINAIRSQITDAIIAEYPDASWQSTDTVGGEVSAGLKRSAVVATLAAIVLMLIYIAIRFEVSSAFAAILCLAHDVIVMLFAYSILQIPVGSTVIATVLTILGYSINATIIIFDRIRENVKSMPHTDFAGKVDAGVRSTLKRSVNTTITTLFTIGLIYILGVTSIKNFALPLIVGILAGAYSSICLSGCFWYLFRTKGKR